MTGSYDPEFDLLYWGIGNPKPDFNTAARKGDNLYTNSVVALRGATGERVWHFQFTPADITTGTRIRCRCSSTIGRAGGASRNACSGRIATASTTCSTGSRARTSSASRSHKRRGHRVSTPSGRPLALPGDSGNEGRLLYPGNFGATHWSSPTYYPQRDLLIVPVLEQGMVYFPSASSPPRSSGRAFYTAVRALNAKTGDLVWEHKRPSRLDNELDAGPGLDGRRTGIRQRSIHVVRAGHR